MSFTVRKKQIPLVSKRNDMRPAMLAGRMALLTLSLFYLMVSGGRGFARQSESEPSFIIQNDIGKNVLSIRDIRFSKGEKSYGKPFVEVQNISDFPIRALGFSAVFDLSDGQQWLMTFGGDSFIHSDVARIKQTKLFMPREYRRYTVNDERYVGQGVTVKALTIVVEYVEFADGRFVAEPESRIKQQMDGVREGAARYKRWLVETYRKNQDVNGIIALMMNEDVPELFKDGDASAINGAGIYRRCLIEAYRKNGVQFLRDLLEESNREFR